MTPKVRPAVCAAEHCSQPVPAYAGRGRPCIYCSPRCRATAGPAALCVEVDHEPDENGGRPAGRVWLVRMRRGKRTVIVATELGRPSAEHLASQIADLIGRRRTKGGAID